MEHTKGPWFQRPQGSEIEIRSGIKVIAMVHDYSGDDNKANAKLIIAAPDLLQTLQDMVNAFPNSDKLSGLQKGAINYAKEAIIKATNNETHP